ncbi:MAG: phospholipid carrier-dependent glycosyltransferase [Isosphaeraceae bacterium]|nr:phospholipid carrier-dependent glycosyltransferase [Isosphaeraceae bacterium]
MPETSPESGDFTRPARSCWRWGAAVGLAALIWFLVGLPSEPHFVDESAYISQSFYADLALRGDVQSAAWLDYPAYDLPPLPKYLIGGALALGGYDRPGMEAARQWYRNTASRFEPPGALETARVPSAILGALGCVAVYGLGLLLRDVKTGVAASLLLMANPLYRVHARRAMSDVPAEAFVLLGLWAGLWFWREALEGRLKPATWAAAVGSGVAAGLATLCKFNGALAMIVLLGWAAIAAELREFPLLRRVCGFVSVLVAGAASLATFGLLNPFITAHPRGPLQPEIAALARLDVLQRCRLLVRHRVEVSTGQQRLFSHNAVVTPSEKVRVTAVQGFGRFGPWGPLHDDSTRRYDVGQDRGALIWIPWVAVGACWAWFRGREQRRAGLAPTAWAILAQAVLALAIVTAYLPLAWNRYFLSIQAGSALLAAGVAVAAGEQTASRIRSAWRGN